MMDLKKICPRRNNHGSMRIHIVPFLMWSLAVLGVCSLLARKDASFEALGGVDVETQLDLSKQNDMQVEIIKNDSPSQATKSKVTDVSPVIEKVSTNLLIDQKVHQPILISIPSSIEVVLSEIIGIREL